ncbi:hypothetical protein Godav_028576, partial [Gossypium davidsonii]|nr:hypothetical protein [Gossypium davidsonii]
MSLEKLREDQILFTILILCRHLVVL